MSTVRLYGRTTNWGSHAQVTEGFRIALEHHGRLAGLMPSDLAVDEDEVPGRAAEWGLLTGPLSGIGEISPTHRFRAAVVAPNSSRIPPAVAKVLNENIQLVIAPSKWAEGVLRSELREPVVITVPHGVHPDMGVRQKAREERLQDRKDGRFHLLHFSTTDRGRKGTIELLIGWELAFGSLPNGSTLTLVLDPNALARLVDDLSERNLPSRYLRGVKLVERVSDPSPSASRMGAPPSMMADFLATAHCVIQPSRGEGFGLIPLEARACGVPVIATTNATGHTEHLLGTSFRDGVVDIAVGPDAPIDDVPGSMAPSLHPTDIAAAILEAEAIYETLHENALEMAAGVQQRWAWPEVVKPLIRYLDEETVA